jgi:hypothetical protein
VVCAESQDVVIGARLQDKRFWNLSEMITFVAHSFVSLLNLLRDLEESLKKDPRKSAWVAPNLIDKHVRPLIQHCRSEFGFIELRTSIARIDEQILVKLRDGVTVGELEVELRVLRETIESEVTGHEFAYIAQDKTTEYRNWKGTWKRVLDNFDEARKEVDQAVVCFALEFYTATVFHMMRVAEIGLRSLASKISVTLKHDIELEDWNTILKAVDKQLEDLHNSPKTASRQAELKVYSDVASHLRYMKAWRNDMAHVRCVYNEGEAKSALTRVRELMELMCP